MTDVERSVDDEAVAGEDAARASRHLRGSTLLLVGRLISIAIDLVARVLIVRYLSKEDYGAFAFALSVAGVGSSIALLGLDKAMTRFIPIYEEHGERGKLMGGLVMAALAILGIGLSLVLILLGLQGQLSGEIVENETGRQLLLILILLAPLQALDSVLVGMLAVFSGPRAIFLRRYILAPGLQLLVVLLLTVTGSSVQVLGIGWVAAGALGIAIYGGLFVRTLAQRGYFTDLRHEFRMPAREIFGFSLPLLSSDLVLALRTTLVVIILQVLATSSDVAEFQAVVPLAKQNVLVLNAFSVLFMPAAARLLARNQHAGIDDLYARTALWIAIMTFPVFVASFALAEPLTVLFFGERYASSGPILALLAVGQYTSALFGFNSLTLRVYARVRYIVAVDMLTAAVSVVLLFVMIDRFGALGAAVATCATLVAQNLLYQYGIARQTRVRAVDATRLKAWALIAVAAGAVAIFQAVADPPLLVGIAVAGLASLLVLGVNRQALAIGETFPEILRIPFAGRLLGGPRG